MWSRGTGIFLQQIKNFLEECLQLHMSLKDIETLLDRAEIPLDIFKLVWNRLKDENQEFFKKYHYRLSLKNQIIRLNELLKKQADVMSRLQPAGSAASNIAIAPEWTNGLYSSHPFTVDLNGGNSMQQTHAIQPSRVEMRDGSSMQPIMHNNGFCTVQTSSADMNGGNSMQQTHAIQPSRVEMRDGTSMQPIMHNNGFCTVQTFSAEINGGNSMQQTHAIQPSLVEMRDGASMQPIMHNNGFCTVQTSNADMNGATYMQQITQNNGLRTIHPSSFGMNGGPPMQQIMHSKRICAIQSVDMDFETSFQQMMHMPDERFQSGVITFSSDILTMDNMPAEINELAFKSDSSHSSGHFFTFGADHNVQDSHSSQIIGEVFVSSFNNLNSSSHVFAELPTEAEMGFFPRIPDNLILSDFLDDIYPTFDSCENYDVTPCLGVPHSSRRDFPGAAW